MPGSQKFIVQCQTSWYQTFQPANCKKQIPVITDYPIPDFMLSQSNRLRPMPLPKGFNIWIRKDTNLQTITVILPKSCWQENEILNSTNPVPMKFSTAWCHPTNHRTMARHAPTLILTKQSTECYIGRKIRSGFRSWNWRMWRRQRSRKWEK